MNCSLFKRNFSAYLDGELDNSLLASCESHLEQCPSCARLLAAYRTGIASLSESTGLQAPEGLFERVLAGVSPKRVNRGVQWRTAGFWVPLAAAAMLILALSFSMYQSGGVNPAASLEVAALDSTLDVVTGQLIAEQNKTPQAHARAIKAYLTSYSPEESADGEASLSYGVSHHPDLVEGGVHTPRAE